MIPRYTPPEFAKLWSATTKYETWLLVELAACAAMEADGLVPAGTAESIRNMNLALDVDAIDAIEARTRHDVIAFLSYVEERAGAPARYLHLGMTSSDVLDTSLAIILTRALDAILARHERLLEALARRARELAQVPVMGRSHGIWAEPTTMGLVLAGHYAELARGKTRLLEARKDVAVGKLSGAVGTYAHLSPEIEARAMQTLGLRSETVSTQVVARDRHAACFQALALVAAGVERLATNIRHLQRSEVREAEEAFASGQKGSSAMPHKRNPISSENLCGLARMVRAATIPALENVSLWHERDISHSSVERMIAPDATTTTAYMLERAAALVDNLVFFPEAMRRHVDEAGGLYFSEAVMLRLVNTGVARQTAYEWVQGHAMRAWTEGVSFPDAIRTDPRIQSRLGLEELARCFDLDHALRHVPVVIERALSGHQ